MERMPNPTAVEDFITSWEIEFPNYPLTIADLKKSHSVMGALFQIFNRLGIDKDVIIMPPPESERDEHTVYYWDLLPVINMTRVIRHIVSVMPQMDELSISIVYFLQPTEPGSFSLLLLLFNLMVFYEERLRVIEPDVKELFAKRDKVKMLEDKNNKLVEKLNEQAENKAKRADRIKKLDHEIQQFEEELKLEKEAYDEEKQKEEAVLEENRQIEMLLEQKKGQRDALVAEVARKKALRVYDADDIKGQIEQARQMVQEVEEASNALRATLMQKENILKNLQTIKSGLDTANNLLHDVIKLSESLRDYETGDFDLDSQHGELEVLHTELSELQTLQAELKTTRDAASAKRQESQAKRQQKKTLTLSAFRDAEDKDKKCNEKYIKALQRTEEIKKLTIKYEERKTKGLEELKNIETTFTREIKACDELFIKKLMEYKLKLEEKVHNQRQ